MRILCADLEGDILPIALALQGEGHEVHLYIERKAFQERGEGLLSKIQSLEGVSYDLGLLGWGLGKWRDILSFSCVGASSWSDEVMKDKRKQKILGRMTEQDGGGWWTGERFIATHSLQLNHGFMKTGVGPRTVNSLHIHMQPIRFGEKLEQVFRSFSYEGPLYIQDGDVLLGFMSGPFAALREKMRGTLLSFFLQMKEPHVGGATAYHVSTLPYPTPVLYPERIELQIEPPVLKHLSLIDVKWKEGLIGGLTTGNLGWVTAFGDKGEALGRIKRSIQSLHRAYPSLQYATFPEWH